MRERKIKKGKVKRTRFFFPSLVCFFVL